MSGPIDDPRVLAAILYEEAVDRRHQGNMSGALARFRRCLELVDQLGDRAWRARIEMEIADLHHLQHELDDATRWYEQARTTCQSLGDRAGAGRAEVGLGQVALLRGDLEQALTLLAAARAELAAAEDPLGVARAELGLAIVAYQAGDREEALRRLVHAHAPLAAENAPEALTASLYLARLRDELPPERFARLVAEAGGERG